MKGLATCSTRACGGVLLVACAAAAQAGPRLELPSCVAGSPPLLLAGVPARLEAADRRQLHEAAQARYPLYQQGGIAPSEALLAPLRRGWVYVTLAPLAGDASCVVAVFAAERFDFTERWLARYRPRTGHLDD